MAAAEDKFRPLIIMCFSDCTGKLSVAQRSSNDLTLGKLCVPCTWNNITQIYQVINKGRDHSHTSNSLLPSKLEAFLAVLSCCVYLSILYQASIALLFHHFIFYCLIRNYWSTCLSLHSNINVYLGMSLLCPFVVK